MRTQTHGLRTGAVSKAVCALVASLATFLLASSASANEVKWRQTKFDDGAFMLYIAETAEATDAIGSISFHCAPGSGAVKVSETNIQDKSVRAAIADLILNDGYPIVRLDPGPETSVLDKIASYDSGGWGYDFNVAPNDAAFKAFEKTGFFKFKIGNAAVRFGIEAGRGDIARFGAACRKTP
ncbi:hypothetical protein [Bradyrhizobium sp. NP1]|uniref:hypothetical protein n=1 Tax=Bradyrhizobium sp. NP1 TaxID=3049772 RepID=UPI0025A514AD|nr:hypothetical protein [Bradyrhizobium sp. NP1]WJR77684.1 hypothetical protein QOU61_34090 [Bradyrhizobium sp. NP1]